MSKRGKMLSEYVAQTTTIAMCFGICRPSSTACNKLIGHCTQLPRPMRPKHNNSTSFHKERRFPVQVRTAFQIPA